MFGEINLSGIQSEHAGDFSRADFLQHAIVKHLILLGLHALPYARQGGLKEGGPPLFLPSGVQLCVGWQARVRQVFRLSGKIAGTRLSQPTRPVKSPKLVVNSSPSDEQQPLFEGTFRGLVMKFGHSTRDSDHRVLHHLLRGVIGKSALAGDIVDEPPVSVEERAPTVVVADIP